MNKESVEDAVKQLVLANSDSEILSLAYIMINHKGDPELQIAMAPGTAYSLIAALEMMKMRILSKLMLDGGIEVKDRE